MATQATLVNPAGKKVVVESGSQQAQQYFGQGYKLMTPANTPAASAPPGVTIPKGMTVIATPADIPKYNVGGQFGQTGQPGSGLYGTLKPTTAPAPVTPAPTAPINNVNDANAHINSDQQSNFDTASKTDDPATRTSASAYTDIFKQVSESLKSGLPEKIATPNLTQKYTDLRSQYGVTDLETSLADLNKQARDIQTISRQRTQAELDKPVAMNVIAGRVTEEERQDNERLMAVNSSIQQVSDQLKTKYNVIDSLLKYSDMDYDNAKSSYDSQFSQNLQVMNTVKGMVDTANTQAEQKADDARANLQIIYNNFKTNNIDPTTIDEAQKTNIAKMELQAGLPQGFYANVVDKNPKADIISTTTRDDQDKKYVDLVMRDKDGKIKVVTQYIGQTRTVKGTGSTTPKAPKITKEEIIAAQSKDLAANAGPDNYVSPQEYEKQRRAWTQKTGYTAKEFDDAFADVYTDPKNSNYRVTVK